METEKQGAPVKEPKTITLLYSGRKVEERCQVNPEIDGSGHWEIDGDSNKFVPQDGCCK